MRSNQQTSPKWASEFLGVFQGNDAQFLPLGAFVDALNYEIYPMGQLAPRLGFSRVSDTIAPDGKEIKTIFPANFDGTTRELIATTDHVYERKLDDSWSLIYTILSKKSRVAFDTLNEGTTPIVVFGNGKDRPQKWDGLTVTPLSMDAPKGRPVVWKDYVIMFDIDDMPGQVHFSIDPGDPDTWTEAATGRRHYLDTVGPVTGVFPHTSGLMVFTARRTEIYRGEPDQLTSMDVLSRTVGCASHESICDCAGYTTWVSFAGPMVWDGSGFFPSMNIGVPNDPGVSNITRDVQTINWAKTEYISGIYHPAKSRYMFSAKIQPVAGGTEYDRTWVYDFIKKTWMPWSLAATAMAVVKASDVLPEKIYIGRADGAVLQNSVGVLTGNFADQGATDATNETYQYWILSNLDDMGDPMLQKMFRAFWFNVSTIEGDEVPAGRTLQLLFYGDFAEANQSSASARTSQRGFVMDVSVLADEEDPTTWDASRLYDYAKEEIFKRFKLRAKRIQFKIYGSGKDTAVALSALAIEFRPLGKRLEPIK